ncbi:GspH/FimT family pseudopilin [Pseudomonas sp. OTU5201]|uniref:GspH/FimT family pseudopilin n=1 Tax=Pseudomonas sp. OTU5201 TaxID=3043850 RepID=UPI00406C0D4C
MRGVPSRGFTLVELMVTLALIAILAVMAVPSFRSFIANQQVKTASYDLLAALNFARSEAIKRNQDVTVAAVDDDWVAGWEVTSEDGVLKVWDAPGDLDFGDSPTSFTYLPNGRVSGGLSAAVSVCKSEATRRIVNVDMSGHARLSRSGACSG